MSVQSGESDARFVVAELSDPGRRRNNEDVPVIARGEDLSRGEDEMLFGVVDGMGGYQAGEVAAALARDTLIQCFASGGSDVVEWISAAHEAIVSDAEANAERERMGAVLTVGLIQGTSLTIGHVGDTRMYLYRDGVLEQLTQDQSAVGELVRAGHLAKEKARTHHMSNVVYQAVGHADQPPQAESQTLQVQGGDVYLVNSDGLTDVITDEQIAQVLESASTLDEAAERLVEEALTDQEALDVEDKPTVVGGGRDNITIALVRVDGGSSDAAPVKDVSEGKVSLLQRVLSVFRM